MKPVLFVKAVVAEMWKPVVCTLAMGLVLSPWRSHAEPPPPEGSEGTPFKLEPIQAENIFECLKACNTSVESAEEFCRNLPADNKKRKALCWSAVYAGKAACQVFCRAEFGPPRP